MEKFTKNGDGGTYSLPQMAWIFFAVLAVFTYFFGLWLPFFGPDEPRYAQVAREMLERGDWITTTLGGFNWFEKPALLYWVEIVSFKLFGVSEFAARLGPAAFGLGIIASIWKLGRESILEGNGSNSDFANWLGLICASTLGIVVFARGASFDITITFPMTMAMVAYFVFDRRVQRVSASNSSGPHGPSKLRAMVPLILFYVSIGIALLAKGLIGIIFPFAIVGLYHLLCRRLPKRIFIISIVWGTLLAGTIAATWYLPMYQRHGWEFIDEFFIQHHFQRFTSNKYQHPQPFFFYIWVLPLMTLPWMPLFIASLCNLVKGALRSLGARSEVNQGDDQDFASLRNFAIAWLAVPLAFFSFSGSKLPGYILPAVPAAIVITAIYTYGLVKRSQKWALVIYTVACLVFLISNLLLLTVVPRFADFDSARGLIEFASERGYANDRIYGLHTISHSAEFYGAGRLLRDPDGKQKKLYSPAEVAAEMRRSNVNRALVLVPPEHLRQLTESVALRSEVLRDNGEWVIVGVSIE